MSALFDQYCGPPPVPADWLVQWNVDPVLIGGMLITAGLHFVLLQRCDEWSQKRWSFTVVWALLFLLFVSPLCSLSSALFSVRVAHHVVLVTLIPLFAVFALPDRWRGLSMSMGVLVFVLMLHSIVVWGWHEPSLYALALSSHATFWLMQLSIVGTALVFWLGVLSLRAHLFSSVTVLLGATIQMGLLGAIITFAQRPLYAPHVASTEAFGLTALEDQQIAGLIMWVPAVLPYLATALLLVAVQLVQGGQVSHSR